MKEREKKRKEKIPDCCIIRAILSHEIFRSCKKYFRIRKRGGKKKKKKVAEIMALS
jgi:hypothetical protein